MKRTCSAADFDGNCGGERIQRAIDAADDESGRAVVTVGPDGPDDGGTWLLEQAVELPSHTTLSLRGAHLRLAEGANDNLLRNRHLEDGDEEIHVIGDGEARIDGTPEAQDRDWDALYRNYGSTSLTSIRCRFAASLSARRTVSPSRLRTFETPASRASSSHRTGRRGIRTASTSSVLPSA